MEVPAHYVEALNAINGGLELRWNPTAKLAKHGSIDASGAVTPPEFEPRWEVWQKPDGEPSQRFCTWQNEDGSFRPLDERLLIHLRKINPENYGGDVTKMVAALVDDPQALAELARDQEADDVLEMAAKWAYWKLCPKTKIAPPKPRGTVYHRSLISA